MLRKYLPVSRSGNHARGICGAKVVAVRHRNQPWAHRDAQAKASQRNHACSLHTVRSSGGIQCPAPAGGRARRRPHGAGWCGGVGATHRVWCTMAGSRSPGARSLGRHTSTAIFTPSRMVTYELVHTAAVSLPRAGRVYGFHDASLPPPAQRARCASGPPMNTATARMSEKAVRPRQQPGILRQHMANDPYAASEAAAARRRSFACRYT